MKPTLIFTRAPAALLIPVLALALNGCAGAGLALATTGAGIGGGVAVDHTLSGIAYKTVVAPENNVHAAALRTLQHMDMAVVSDTPTDHGHTIAAKAQDRDISLEFEGITSRTTRMRVTADRDDIPFLKDQSTATEIIVQTLDEMDRPAAVAQATEPARKHTSRRQQ
jgi:hypothetical protein